MSRERDLRVPDINVLPNDPHETIKEWLIGATVGDARVVALSDLGTLLEVEAVSVIGKSEYSDNELIQASVIFATVTEKIRDRKLTVPGYQVSAARARELSRPLFGIEAKAFREDWRPGMDIPSVAMREAGRTLQRLASDAIYIPPTQSARPQ